MKTYISTMSSEFFPEQQLTHAIIGAFFDVYNNLGFGFLEFVYSLALERELVARGHTVEREVNVPVFYKEKLLTMQRIDLVVDGRILVEIKSTAALSPTARRQTLNYLRATTLEVGLLLHFGPAPQAYRVVDSRPAH